MRHTKWAARFVLALRSEMSIKVIARFVGMHWETVKNIVYDHFRVIKPVNERMNKLEDEQKK